MQKQKVIILMIIMALALAACNSGGDAQPTEQSPTPEPTAATDIPAPTDTPAPTEPPAAEPVSQDQIVNIVWQWSDLTETEPAGQSVVADPENYTVTFLEDGQANIKADCNFLSWTYTLEGNSLTFNTLGATTLAFCGEDSQDQQFLGLLGQVTSVALGDSDRLELSYGEGAGIMGFNNGGSAETEEGGAEVDAEQIIGVTWSWQSFQDQSEENDISVPDPENYTLTLMPDGTAAIQADCNRVSWTYMLDGSNLTFNTLGPTTLALCPPDSLDQQYLSLLGSVATWVPGDDGNLVLNLMADAGNMIFSPIDENAETCVTGSITTAETQELPEDAIIQIQIQDTSLADAQAPVIGQQILEAAGAQFPILYKVCYDPDDINDNLMYGMSVRITAPDGTLLFISDTNTPVITQGFPTTDVEVGVVRVN